MSAFSWNGVNYRESTAAYVSPEEAWGQDEQKIAAEWMINWSDRQNARVALLGTSNIRSQATPPGVWSTPPASGTIIENGEITDGTWTITITFSDGTSATTTPLSPTALPIDVQNALSALVNYGIANPVTVTRSGLDNFSVVFAAQVGPVTLSIDNSALVGGEWTLSTGTSAWLSRTLPHLYPDPAGNWLYARSVPYIRGWATPRGKDATNIMQYSDGKVGVLYGSLPYDVQPDGFFVDESTLYRFVHRAAPVVKERVRTFRDGSWKWIGSVGADGQLRTAPGAEQAVWCTSILEYIWYAVPAANIPRQYILGVAGWVNINAFDGCAPGTLLIKSPRWNYYKMPDGQWGADVHTYFEHNPKGWNNYPDVARNNEYYPIGRLLPGGRIVTPYPYADIRPMFRPSLTG